MQLARLLLALFPLFPLFASAAEHCSGRVLKVADGDTPSVRARSRSDRAPMPSLATTSIAASSNAESSAPWW